ncbi:hypothetical protein Mesil_0420 [Allomeiothermus silvanus DSM 9946]|uniref:Uncharacterized protein n=1 Tax=Allomeiothermus silvanus (strain ATCC 700542 / DSM 9946 / NBRC 106475 / NCIMB 13440 / VI-R2) TaxID=526227 RepID=D7BI86_ALLS1|nr:hypothetical protein [Allomeiothermus silvanus]ADH62360.1 hypothetical protein Mesil_0420 [Allomeiothermus silvanus DSM 9946]
MSKQPNPFIFPETPEDNRQTFDEVLETLSGECLGPNLTRKLEHKAREAQHPWLPAKDTRQQGRFAQVKRKERVRRRP